MKKLTLFLSALLSVQISAQNISGCITSMPDSISNIKVAYVRGKGLAVKQEIPVNNGCFNAAWEHPEQGIFIVYIDGGHTFDMVVSNGNLKIQGDYNALENVQLSGPGIEEFNGFKGLLKSDPNEEQIRNYLLAIKDNGLREFLLPQILPLNPDTNVYWLRSHFWDYTNLRSKSTIINPFFEKNRKIYFEQVLGHDPDTVIKHLNTLLNSPMDDQVRKVLVSTATYHYETSNYMGEDKVFVWLAQTFYNSGFADWMDKDDLAKIKEKSDGLSTELIGNPARDFAFDTKDRGRIKLTDVQSPITILYFWDSTCGHCKKETPRLKKFYEEYKDKGVEVVAITLENEFTSWNKYIDENELTWINGYESDFERPNFLWYYYIPTTPKKLVLNKDKKIIAKNLDVETTLRTFIDDYLAGKVK
ncbi:MAG: thioredoxin-like domain-containing protein [Schleiferiaceae bacterium]|jgi:thiol-disulfide isomerase/thioredoxin